MSGLDYLDQGIEPHGWRGNPESMTELEWWAREFIVAVQEFILRDPGYFPLFWENYPAATGFRRAAGDTTAPSELDEAQEAVATP